MSATATATGFTNPKTPYEEYFSRRSAWLNLPENKHITGTMLIRGIPANDDDDDGDTSNFTTEQMNSLRFIMLTQNRDDQFEAMGKLVLGEQYGSPFMMFGTSFSYDVLNSWDYIKPRLGRMSTDKKFDTLLGYTFTLQEYDAWMSDNEGDMGTLVKGLATVWRNLLKKSDQEIGWDVQYTKPATYEMLRQFKESIEGMDDYFEMGKFKYE